MGCLFNYRRVSLGYILATGRASHGFESDGAARVGDSLAELCAHLCDGCISRAGAIRE